VGAIVHIVFEVVNDSSRIPGALLRFSKPELYRRIEKGFEVTLSRVQQSLPDLDDQMFRRMLRMIKPSRENYLLAARNHAAHKFTIADARESAAAAAEEDSECLLRGIDSIGASDDDYLDEVAVRKGLELYMIEPSRATLQI
jgi:hypothetical protein